MNLLVCDDCKKRDREAQRAALWTKFMVPDPAGGPATRDYKYVDLCLTCAILRLEREYDRS